MDGIFGLAAFGFWMFVAAAAVAGIWDGVRKRDAQHETLRRMIESGKEPDPVLVDKLIGTTKKPARDLKVGGRMVIFVAPGLALLGWVFSLQAEAALLPLLGGDGWVAFVGIGLLPAASFLEKANREETTDNSQMFR